MASPSNVPSASAIRNQWWRSVTPGRWRPTAYRAAIAPFKYREESVNQYLKMAKKINAGANYLITNCGWDMRKLAELAWSRRRLPHAVGSQPAHAHDGLGRGIHSHRLPGVFMSDDLFEKIGQEHARGKASRKAAYRSLQIVGAALGYAGVQLSGVDTTKLCSAMEKAHELGHSLPSSRTAIRLGRAHRLPPADSLNSRRAADCICARPNPRPAASTPYPDLAMPGPRTRRGRNLDACRPCIMWPSSPVRP